MNMKRLIFIRVAALMVLMAIALSSVGVYYAVRRHREITIDMWQSRCRVLADALRNNILWDDRVTVRQMLLSELHESEALFYSFVVKRGEPYVSTFEHGVPAHLVQQPLLVTRQLIREQYDQTGAAVYDIATPIDNDGTLLWVGLKRSVIDRKMGPFIFSVAMITLVIIGIGLYLARVISRWTTREVDALADAIRTYGELNNRPISVETTSSEVTELVKSFRQLTASRNEAESKLSLLNAQLEQRVVERTALLEEANKELVSFSYSVSHDLRAPLRGIDGWSLALLEDYQDKLDDQARHYLALVRSETQRMGQLIDDMLQLSRLSLAELRLTRVNLSRLAGGIADRLKAENPGRQMNFVIQPGLMGQCDEGLLEIALTNLLNNAVKYTGRCQQACIEFGMIDQDGFSVFFVRDNGAGFDMAYAQKLFGPFQRMHKASEFPGNGVGLATVKRVIRRHGGKVWAEAKVDQGATFFFTITANQKEPV